MWFSRYMRDAIRSAVFIHFTTTPNGDGEIRTLDPLLARQVLSQLSYTPIKNLAPTCSPMPSPA